MRKVDTARTALTDLVLALTLMTRLPMPRLPRAAFECQAGAVWAFPLVGAVVGVLAGAAGLAALALGLPAPVAAGLVLAVQILATGAMHEDGLADTADGLWGGWTPERRLEIMKDSAIGTYGVLALVLTVGLRWAALTVLMPQGGAPVVAAAVLSRAGLPVLMRALPPARAGGLSRQVGAPTHNSVSLSVVLGFGLGWLAVGPPVLAPVLTVLLAVCVLALVARARIGGQTGDILGAAQQLAELAALLALCAV
ncbi:adenosylcobinamide-GDP ribazoletransferase [Sedimentitalea sp. HM32M-2]|uniref:adenosylcobinamide-GDP ribazoletransferase n=1 Tax=Sedimentitalea sp. HM32M-2 TaxID=3351566 RepID=UPI00362C0E9E